MKQRSIFVFVAALVLLALAACAPAAQVSQSPQIPQVSANGAGVVYVVPDIAYINVGVRSQGDSVAEALEANNAQAKAIKDTLMQADVAEKDIQTSSFNVYPQSDYDFQGNITRTYFSVENNLNVTVRSLNDLGVILDAVAKSGANNIYGISFDVQDKAEGQTKARQLAVDAARKHAQELAAAAGVELGEILTISSYLSYPTPYYGYGVGGGGGAGMASNEAVPIASGQIQINSDVTLVYAIK